ncbi:TPA: MerR family transcriptional regulator [Clostridioides difficile]
MILKSFLKEGVFMYSIGEISKITGISISTLRYYDREGMFPSMERSTGGIRIFSENELRTIRVIECLKSTGMSIKAIKDYLKWCQEGDASLCKRQKMFHDRLKEVEKQLKAVQANLNTLKYKCWYYDKAVTDETEDLVKNLSDDEIPAEIRDYKI